MRWWSAPPCSRFCADAALSGVAAYVRGDGLFSFDSVLGGSHQNCVSMLVNRLPGDRTDDIGKEISKIALAVALIAGGILAVTGIWLLLFYTPSAAGGYPFQPVDTAPKEVLLVDWIRVAHRVSATIFIITLILVLAAAVVRVIRGHRRVVSVIAPGLAGILATLAMFSGRQLAFDRLVPLVVEPNQTMAGYRLFVGDHIRLVVVAGQEAATTDVKMYLVLHFVLIPGALVALLVIGRAAASSAGESAHAGVTTDGDRG